MLVDLHLDPVAHLQVVHGSAHRSHGAGFAHLDVGIGWECDGDLASIVERDDSKALGRIKLTDLTGNH